MRVGGPSIGIRKICANAAPTLLRYASVITEQKKCWDLLAQTFDRFQTLCNDSQQHVTTCNRVSKRTQHVTSNNVGTLYWPTMYMLRPFFARDLCGTCVVERVFRAKTFTLGC